MARRRQRKGRERPRAQAAQPAGATASHAAPVAWRPAALAALLVGATFVAYVPAIGGGFIWDDNIWVIANRTLRDVDGLRRMWLEPSSVPQFYPLVHTTFWIEYHLWELAPRGYHLVNVALHAASAVVLWRLLVWLAIPGAWFAAAIFALHPVHVESVAWITERKNVLSCLFYLLALRVYLPFALASAASRPWGRYALAVALFVCALLSKTVTASLPAAILLIVWWKRGRLGWRDVVPLLPMFAVGAASGLMTAWVERHQVGAQGAEWDFSLLDRCLIAGRALWFYAAKLLWPAPLVFVYPRWEIDDSAWWQYLFPVGVAAAVATLWAARARLGRGPLVAVLFFAGTLFPALGFVNVFPMRFSFVADHFQYHASIGLIVVFAAAAATAVHRLDWPREAVAAGAVAVLGTLGVLTWAQGGIYRDLPTLYRDTLAKNPNAWMAHNNLGQILEREGKIQEAFEHFSTTVRLNDGFPEGHNNLGAVLEKLARTEEAIEQYRIAVRMLPSYADANYNLGRVLRVQGRNEEAVEYLTATTEIRPTFAPARRNLALALAALGRTEEAIAQYEAALRIEPRHAEAHLNLGKLLEERGDGARAIEHYAAALRLDPRLAEARSRLEAASPR